MDFIDFMAIVTYILFLFFIITCTASFIDKSKSLKVDIYFLVVTVLLLLSVVSGCATGDRFSPNTVSSVKTYRSYSTTYDAVGMNKIYYVGDTKVDPSGDNNKIVTLTYHGSKPKYRAKLVTKTFSKEEKQQISRSQWNIYKGLGVPVNRVDRVLYIVK